MSLLSFFSLFFFNDTATTEIYTLSLHDALPISFVFADLEALPFAEHSFDFVVAASSVQRTHLNVTLLGLRRLVRKSEDRKSTRLNSSHDQISYAVFCLKKKKKLQYLHIYRHYCI